MESAVINGLNTLENYCKHYEACDSAMKWVNKIEFDISKAWRECKHADWMLWLVTREPEKLTQDDFSVLRLAVCDCVEPMVIRHWPDADSAPRIALATARRYARGDATEEELRKARIAAWCIVRVAARAAERVELSAAEATTWAAAEYAARAAAQTVARVMLSAAEAAVEYVTAARAAAERTAEHRRMCDLIRSYWPTCEFKHLKCLMKRG